MAVNNIILLTKTNNKVGRMHTIDLLTLAFWVRVIKKLHKLHDIIMLLWTLWSRTYLSGSIKITMTEFLFIRIELCEGLNFVNCFIAALVPSPQIMSTSHFSLKRLKVYRLITIKGTAGNRHDKINTTPVWECYFGSFYLFPCEYNNLWRKLFLLWLLLFSPSPSSNRLKDVLNPCLPEK